MVSGNKTIAAIIASNHAVQLRLDKEKPETQDGWMKWQGDAVLADKAKHNCYCRRVALSH